MSTLHKMITKPLLYLVIIIALNFFSCKKFVTVDAPVTSTNSSIVYASDETATAVLTGIYTGMSQAGIGYGLPAMNLYPGLSADELVVFKDVTDLVPQAYVNNALSSTNTAGTDFWNNVYPVIYVTNDAIEGLTASKKLTPAVKQQLLGEARFMRAFCYFYLVNLYGDVPLVLTSDYRSNSNIPRTAKKVVYQQIIADLLEAQSLLGADYLDFTFKNQVNERISPNKWVATALLSRVYLYDQQYVKADAEASRIIDNTALFQLVPLDQVFLGDSKEAIWQLQSVDPYISNTPEGRFFILPPEGPNIFEHPVVLSQSLDKSFEPGDQRKVKWLGNVMVDGIDYTYPFKYKVYDGGLPTTERSVVFRLAEQFLIRAEARLQQNNTNDAIKDLNAIRTRAGLNNWVNPDNTATLNAILHERQVELFTEWGHRWLDLKRLGKADEILGKEKGAQWQTTDQLYPIPQNDMDHNPALKGAQNPGY